MTVKSMMKEGEKNKKCKDDERVVLRKNMVMTWPGREQKA